MILLRELLFTEENFDDVRPDTNMYNAALDIASIVHDGQTRKATGNPYIVHPIAVVDNLRKWNKDDITKLTAAVLHDTVEDAKEPESVKAIIKKRFGDKMLSIINLLSHKVDDTYESYLQKLTKNIDAVWVKLADIKNNLMDNPSAKQVKKYHTALQLIQKFGIHIPNDLIKLSNKLLNKA